MIIKQTGLLRSCKLLLLLIFFPIAAGIISGVLFIRREKNGHTGTKHEDISKGSDAENGIIKGSVIYICIMAVTLLLSIPVFVSDPGDISMTITGNADFCFGVDGFTRLSLFIVLLLYSTVLFYALVYFKKEHNVRQFFIFYFVSLGAIMAVCLSRSLITLYCCFEIATLSSMPMVLNEMDRESVAAGVKYLFYSVGGALMGLCGVLAVYSFAEENVHFVFGGFLEREMIAGSEPVFLALMMIAVIGFGTKAGIYPMHGWLPTAHPIAPAPASALLSGIIAKAGIIALVRLIYYSVGPSVLQGTYVQRGWMLLSMITVIIGSSMAFLEKNLKKRLAYSTVSQLLLQMMAHAAAKSCLFLTAGAIIYLTGCRYTYELRGIGKKMPLTMICFTLCSLSLIGIPPMGGFTAKWKLSLAALSADALFWSVAPVIVLIISALLTSGYLMPVVIGGFFPAAEDATEIKREKEPVLMVVPMYILSAAALIVGLYGSRILELISW